MEILTKSAKETQRFGKELGIGIKKGKKYNATIIALTGDLGSGKTTFLQGFAKGIGVSGRILSPTFVLMRRYPLKKGYFYHIDLYRFEKNADEELVNIGFKEFMENPENIIAIEWAERARSIMPKYTTWITFNYNNGDERKVKILQ